MTTTLILNHPTRGNQTFTTGQPVAPAIVHGQAEGACARVLELVSSLVSLDARDRDAVINAVKDVVVVDSGRLIPFSARPSTHLYLLVEGWALRSNTIASGARLITDVVLPGDLFAWMPTDFYDAETELRACGSTRVAILRYGIECGSDTLSRCWASTRDTEARTLRSRLVSLGRRDARARIAHLMSELHHRLNRAGLSEGNTFECPLTQEHIADILGLTPVHVNRVLQRLRREGLLNFDRRRVELRDLDRVQVEAGFDVRQYDSDRRRLQ